MIYNALNYYFPPNIIQYIKIYYYSDPKCENQDECHTYKRMYAASRPVRYNLCLNLILNDDFNAN